MSAFTGEHSFGLVPREAHATGDEGWKKPKTGDEVLLSMKVTEVDGSVDENRRLKCTVGDKSQGLLSWTIDEAWGGMQGSSEDAAQNNHPVNSVQNRSTEASSDTHEDPTHSPPEWESTWLSQTASAKSRANDEKVISDKTATEKAESENVVAESVLAQEVSTETEMVEKTADEKMAIAKSTVANVADDEVIANTTTVQQEVPRDVGPSAIGRKTKARRILGWRQLASGLQMRRKTQVFRLLRHRIFDRIFQQRRQGVDHTSIRNVLCSAHRAVWSDRWNA